MRKIMLLHISECGGHKRASQNIQEALGSIDPSVEILSINGFGHLYPWTERIVGLFYTATIKRFPSLWGRVYDRKKVVRVTSPIKRFVNRLSFGKFSRLIDNFNPDAVVATQAFPCGLAADFKAYYGLDFPIFAVVTDYHPHRFWINPCIDAYVVACQDAKKTLIDEVVDEDKIKTFGIPISLKFLGAHKRDDIASSYGFKMGMPSVLVMGGGSGFGPIKDIVLDLDKLDQEFQMIVVCGNNKKLYNWFRKKAKRFKKPLFVFSYVDFVNKLMDFSDIIITKAGGITISEALSKSLAIIVINPIPGQEERNVEYLQGKKAILKASSTKEVGSLTERLLTRKEESASLKERASRCSAKDASLKIANFILSSLD